MHACGQGMSQDMSKGFGWTSGEGSQAQLSSSPDSTAVFQRGLLHGSPQTAALRIPLHFIYRPRGTLRGLGQGKSTVPDATLELHEINPLFLDLMDHAPEVLALSQARSVRVLEKLTQPRDVIP